MEKGTRNLLIVSGLFALGGIIYYSLYKRKNKVLNIYSIGKSADGKILLYITTKSPQAIDDFVKNDDANTAIQKMELAINPSKTALKVGTSVEVKGIEGLDGSYSVLATLSPQTNLDKVMAIKIDSQTIPSTYTSKAGATQGRVYASSAKNVGKLTIK
jgi:hypothetical protein